MKNLLLFCGTALIFLACNTNSSRNETGDKETGGSETVTTPSENGARISDENLEKFQGVDADVASKIIDAYIKIKDALVKTDGQEAKKAAESIQEDLKSAEGEGISLIRNDIEHIANTESVEHQREHFNELSKHVYALVKSTDGSDQKLYRQYCPMAFDNTGAFWLSSSEEIRNPYFGDRMLKCGRVEETL